MILTFTININSNYTPSYHFLATYMLTLAIYILLSYLLHIPTLSPVTLNHCVRGYCAAALAGNTCPEILVVPWKIFWEWEDVVNNDQIDLLVDDQ